MTFPFFLSFEVGKQMDQKNCLTSINRNEITGFYENLYGLSKVEELEDYFMTNVQHCIVQIFYLILDQFISR